MRVTRKQAELNRQRIIDSAIRLFAERGVGGVGVAEVMADAGFTHGGFYNHFPSKEELVNEACATSFARSAALLRDGGRLWQRTQDEDFGECLSAAMLCESAKGDSRLGAIFASGLRDLLDILEDRHGDSSSAVSALSCFVGARVLLRAAQPADRELAERFETMLYPENQPRLHASS